MMELLKAFKFMFVINHVCESDLKDIGIPNNLCKNALTFLNTQEN